MKANKIFIIGLIAVMAVAVFAVFVNVPTASAFSGSGSGTSDDPYIIITVDQLQEMNDDLTAYYALGNDIDASDTITWNGGAGFVPVGRIATPFTGSFDGRGYVISDLDINRPTTNNVGLFGYVGSGGVVENVGLENENVIGNYNVGGLVGYLNDATVSNCYSTGDVSGVNNQAGGLIGYLYAGTVSNSYSTASVSGNYNVGGFAGLFYSGTVSDSYSTGSASGINQVGGFIGMSYATVSNSYSNGSVSGTTHLGGFIGQIYSGAVDNSYSNGDVSGSIDIGGFVGFNWGTVTNCYSIGDVNGSVRRVGGFVGYNSGTVTNCYSRGSASGGQYVGGFVGRNDITVSKCYSTGAVSGAGINVGGFCGMNRLTVTNSFWDKETSGKSTSSGGTGKTTAEMKNVRTFTDTTWSTGLSSPWDFLYNPYEDVGDEDIWDIHPAVNDGYPFLTWAFVPPPSQPQLVSPENDIIINDNTPTFVWIIGTRADNHRLLIDNDNDFSSPNENRLLGAIDNTYTIADENSLAYGSYYWKVVAITSDMENSSETWTFVVDIIPPGTPLKSSPLDGAKTNDNNVNFVWNATTDDLSGVACYELWVDNDSSFDSPEVLENTADNATTNLTKELADENYSWRVRAWDQAGNPGSYETAWTILVDTLAPDTPTLVSPADGENINDNTPNLDWDTVSENSTPVLHRCHVDNDVDFSSVDYDSDWITDDNYQLTELAEGVWYWKVQAKDNAGNIGDNSTSRSFRIDITSPTAPTITYPADGENLNDNTPTITWGVVTENSLPVLYQAIVDNNSDFSSPENDSDWISATTYTPGVLADNLYYLRVRAKDNAGNIGENSQRTFRVDTLAPAAPTITYPADGENTNDDTPTFEWAAVSDPSGAIYTLQIDSENTFTLPLVYENADMIDNTCTLPDESSLAEDTYYWRVQAVDGAGNVGDWSEVWQFTVGPYHNSIYINGNENFTPANGVSRGGDGTADNPYIIENWVISASTAHGIRIQNTTAHFIVRNCLVENGGSTYYGIYLNNADNGRIENNTCENNSRGIYLYSSPYNNLINNTCENNYYYGIYLYSSSYDNLTGNTTNLNTYGIYLYSSSYDNLTNNTCENNYYYGIYLSSSSYDNLTGNTCENNTSGIYLSSSSYDNLTGNTCENNRYNFSVVGTSISHFDHNIDNSNLVNGKSIYYFKDNSDLVVGPSLNIGYLGLVRCDNIRVENLVLENNDQGILLASTENSYIENCIFSNNYYGIYLYSSSYDNLTNNTCENIYYGIYLYSSSYDNLTNNTCENNSQCGIYLYSSNYDNLTGNTCNNNFRGIRLYSSSYNNLTNNTCENNSQYGIYLYSSSNHNNLTSNTCENNTYGIYLYSSSYDNLTGNTTNLNTYGIYLYSSSYDNLTGNMTNSNIYGIYLDSSSSNILTGNVISNSTYDIYNTGTTNTYSSNQFNNNMISKMLTLTENTRTENVGDNVSFSVSAFNPDSTNLGGGTAVTISPSESSWDYSDNGSGTVTGWFIPTKSGTYSLSFTVIDENSNTTKRRMLFFVGNIASTTTTYYFRGVNPTHGQPFGTDSKSLLLTAPTSMEIWTCSAWVQNSPDEIPNYPLANLSNVDTYTWYKQSKVSGAYIGIQRHLTYGTEVDENQSVENVSDYTWINENFAENWAMDYPQSWYWVSIKVYGINPYWTTFPSAEYENQPSYANFTYSYTTTPIVKSIYNPDNILLLSATAPVDDNENATIVLDGTGSTNIVLDNYHRPFIGYTTTINSDNTATIAANGLTGTTTINSVTMDITPSSGSIDVSVDNWNTSGTYYKKWTENGSSPGITASHTIGDLEANTYYTVKVDGAVLDTYQSNPSGQITFTYNGGYSTKTFEIEEYPPVTAPIISPADGTLPSIAPSFGIAVIPTSGFVQQGGKTTAMISITALDGYNSIVTLSVSWQSGVSISLSPSRGVPDFGSTMTIDARSARVGDYLITIQAVGADGARQSVIYSLSITAAGEHIPPSIVIPSFLVLIFYGILMPLGGFGGLFGGFVFYLRYIRPIPPIISLKRLRHIRPFLAEHFKPPMIVPAISLANLTPVPIKLAPAAPTRSPKPVPITTPRSVVRRKIEPRMMESAEVLGHLKRLPKHVEAGVSFKRLKERIFESLEPTDAIDYLKKATKPIEPAIPIDRLKYVERIVSPAVGPKLKKVRHIKPRVSIAKLKQIGQKKPARKPAKKVVERIEPGISLDKLEKMLKA